MATPQQYPRIPDNEKLAGYLDESRLTPHQHKLGIEKLKEIIAAAVRDANKKSSRAILAISDTASEEEMREIYLREGRKLFSYFKDYCGDPASTAFQCQGQYYSKIAAEQFRNRTLQKERMNSGWRYQFMARDCALASQRFKSVSHIGAAEADFNLCIATKDWHQPVVNIYISVKNRSDTVGGQDFPKAVAALENIAQHDRNREGPYMCVFGIAMERGTRTVRKRKDGTYYSVNTEVWCSDFFWPFLSNLTYEEIIIAVVDVLFAQDQNIENANMDVAVPDELIESFGSCCRELGLVDESGKFHDAYKLVNFSAPNNHT